MIIRLNEFFNRLGTIFDWPLVGSKTNKDLAKLKELNINQYFLCVVNECKPAPEMDKNFCCKRIILLTIKQKRSYFREINIALML